MSDTYGRYLAYVALLFVLFSALVAAGNIFIDPYFVFGMPGHPGFNDIRVAAINQPHVVRIYSLENQTPRSLIFGSSRAQIGLNPEHVGFKAKPVYNSGLPGTSMFILLRYFQHALAVSKPQQVILAIDFFQFDTRDPMSVPAPERLAVTLNGQPTPKVANLWQRLLDFRFAVLSSNAVSASWKTIVESRGLDQTLKWVALANGQNVLIHQPPSFSPSTNYATERSFLRNIWSPRFCLVSPETGYNQFDIFRQFVRLAYEHETDLRIFISPAHARLWETIAQAGLWEKWEHWKRQMTRIVLEEAGSKSPFPLWDFSGYNFMTTDSLETMRWYVDPNHYTSEAGDLVLDVLFNLPRSRSKIIGEFGIRLDRETIEPHLARIRADRERWRAAFPAHVAQIEALADEIPNIRINNRNCD